MGLLLAVGRIRRRGRLMLDSVDISRAPRSLLACTRAPLCTHPYPHRSWGAVEPQSTLLGQVCKSLIPKCKIQGGKVKNRVACVNVRRGRTAAKARKDRKTGKDSDEEPEGRKELTGAVSISPSVILLPNGMRNRCPNWLMPAFSSSRAASSSLRSARSCATANPAGRLPVRARLCARARLERFAAEAECGGTGTCVRGFHRGAEEDEEAEW